jgi:hypothetical protein
MSVGLTKDKKKERKGREGKGKLTKGNKRDEN